MSKLLNGVLTSTPELIIPDFRQLEHYGQDYVLFGTDNFLPNYIADLITLSPTHGAIIDSKRAIFNGDLHINIKEGLKSVIDFNNIDTLGGSLEEFTDEIASDAITYESFYIELIYNKPRTRIVGLKRIPYEYVRSGKYNEDGSIDTFYISSDWSKKYIKRNTPRPISAYNPSSIDTDSQLLYMRIKRPNQPYYTIPSYMSAIQWILLEDDIAEFNRNNITSGFFPSMLLNFFNGEPTEDEKAEMEAYIGSKFSGKGASKLMMFFNNDPDKKVQVDSFTPPDIPKYFDSLLPEIRRYILSAHKTAPELMGVSTTSGFSSESDKIITQYRLLLKTSIAPLQKLYISALQKVLSFNKVEADIYFDNEILSNTSSNEDETVEINESKIEGDTDEQ